MDTPKEFKLAGRKADLFCHEASPGNFSITFYPNGPMGAGQAYLTARLNEMLSRMDAMKGCRIAMVDKSSGRTVPGQQSEGIRLLKVTAEQVGIVENAIIMLNNEIPTDAALKQACKSQDLTDAIKAFYLERQSDKPLTAAEEEALRNLITSHVKQMQQDRTAGFGGR